MKNYFLSAFLLLFFNLCFSQNLVSKIEIENGVLNNVYVSNTVGGYSGSGSVTGFSSSESSVKVMVSAPNTGIYELKIQHLSVNGQNRKSIKVNGIINGEITFPETPTGYTLFNVGRINLSKGNNTIIINQVWGGGSFDVVYIYDAVPHDYFNVSNSLIDNQATDETVYTYNYLKDRYGKAIITGQTSVEVSETNSYWDTLVDLVDKTPKLRAWDLQNYSPANPWGYENGQQTFKAFEDGTIQKVINWYADNKDQCGLVSLHWHWLSPTGGTLNEPTFYQEHTTFDIREAVKSGTDEYIATIRDIDAIAEELKRLADNNIPVLWRPLHEAHGNWFWWGTHGAIPVKELWDIMYERLTNYHQLHNLIWVWSSEGASYYPGNSKVDVFGFDSYPADFNTGSQRLVFDQMYNICDGEKIIAMTENGSIPDIDQCFEQDAIWSYFSSWRDLVFEQNSESHLKSVYSNWKVLNQEDGCAIVGLDHDNENVNSIAIYPNPTSDNVFISEKSSWTLFNSLGVLIEKGEGIELDLTNLQSGIYFIKIGGQILSVVKN